jgi:hypothetical protein
VSAISVRFCLRHSIVYCYREERGTFRLDRKGIFRSPLSTGKVITESIHPYKQEFHRYLVRITLDTKLRWKEHVRKKKEKLNIKFPKFKRLKGRHSSLALYNKTIYNQILKPTRLHEIQLSWYAKDSNIKIVPTNPNKILGAMVNTPLVCQKCRYSQKS